jgi:signal transduction histidine kinase
MLALVLALYLSQKISIPINNITNSAVDLSKGEYNVKFEGGHFTELDALAKALNKASYEMQKTDFYQKDMIANVSHDLKTPLTMIRSYAELIQDISGDNPTKRNEHLQVIIDETNHLNAIVSDMLTMSKMQANAVSIVKVDFDLVEAANTVLTTYHIVAEQDGFTIEFNKPKSAYVNGDINKIKQVMSNLITNAIKYSGEDKVILVNIKKVGRRVRFDVIDHGAGIPEDELTHVWERYYKTSVNHARTTEGTGLGLSIVKSILTIHNAHYGVKSKEGTGSDFWFELETVRAPSARTLSL